MTKKMAYIGWPRCEYCLSYYGTDMTGHGDCTKHKKEVRSHEMCGDFERNEEKICQTNQKQ